MSDELLYMYVKSYAENVALSSPVLLHIAIYNGLVSTSSKFEC